MVKRRDIETSSSIVIQKESDLMIADKERQTSTNDRILREAKTKVENSSLVNRYLASSYRDETYNITRSTSDPDK
jgi:hypothetical protein